VVSTRWQGEDALEAESRPRYPVVEGMNVVLVTMMLRTEKQARVVESFVYRLGLLSVPIIQQFGRQGASYTSKLWAPLPAQVAYLSQAADSRGSRLSYRLMLKQSLWTVTRDGVLRTVNCFTLTFPFSQIDRKFKRQPSQTACSCMPLLDWALRESGEANLIANFHGGSTGLRGPLTRTKHHDTAKLTIQERSEGGHEHIFNARLQRTTAY